MTLFAARTHFGICVQPLASETESGDACVTIPWSRGTLLVLADGLGHGPRAAEAAAAFITCVEASRELPLDDVFARSHRALCKTRGAVGTVARFDDARASLEFAGVGNVGTLLLPADARAPLHPIAEAGVLGSVFRNVRPQTFAFGVGDTLLMFSDGVRSRFDVERLRGISPQDAAELVVRTHAKGTDDAACGIARSTVREHAEGSASVVPRDGSRSIPIRIRGDAECAASAARDFAQSAGFSAREQWEISIAVSELATNVLKFAGEGVVRLRRVEAPRSAMVVEAQDHGRGIGDLPTALADGFSEGEKLGPDRPRREGQGLGVGLGSVHRMMSHVEIASEPGRGTRIVAMKFRS